MGCGILWRQINELDRAMNSLRIGGISEISEPFQLLQRARGKLMGQVGLKYPRTVMQLLKIAGLSPGTVSVWHDIESGWMSEARAKPGAPPVYKRISDQVAVQIIKGELTHELEQELMTPDDYMGE